MKKQENQFSFGASTIPASLIAVCFLAGGCDSGGGSSFKIKIPCIQVVRTSDVAVGDIDQDGLSDLVSSNTRSCGRSGHIRVFLQEGGGSFRSTGAITVGRSPRSVAMGDLNGDRLTGPGDSERGFRQPERDLSG